MTITTPQQVEWRAVAAQRRSLAQGWNVARAYSQDNEEVGACGEWTFAVEFRLPWDGHVGAGDQGVDFEVWPFTIDVKTNASTGAAGYLLHETAGPQSRQSKATILVDARYDRALQAATLRGWQWRSEVEKWPLKNFGAQHRDGSLVMSHAFPVRRLLSIASLHRELAR